MKKKINNIVVSFNDKHITFNKCIPWHLQYYIREPRKKQPQSICTLIQPKSVPREKFRSLSINSRGVILSIEMESKGEITLRMERLRFRAIKWKKNFPRGKHADLPRVLAWQRKAARLMEQGVRHIEKCEEERAKLKFSMIATFLATPIYIYMFVYVYSL